MKERKMMKGNIAIAEAAVRAGVDLYAGYPITPQTEVLEHLSHRLPEEGRDFIQAENEIAAINMIYGGAATGMRCFTSSCGPGISLKQEGISYICSQRFPCVILNVQRWGAGLGSLDSSQVDYLRETRGGGNGDYRTIVFAPNSIQESIDIMYESFEVAEKYRNPVTILSEASLGQMMEPCVMPEYKKREKKLPWVYDGNNTDHMSIRKDKMPQYTEKLHKEIKEELQRWEEVMTEDAEYIFVAFGLPSRVAKDAVIKLRKQGQKVGLIRPITLWPFPFKAFEKLNKDNIKGFLSIESNDTGQMVEDVALATKKINSCSPVYLYNSGMNIPTVKETINKFNKILNSKEKEVF